MDKKRLTWMLDIVFAVAMIWATREIGLPEKRTIQGFLSIRRELLRTGTSLAWLASLWLGMYRPLDRAARVERFIQEFEAREQRQPDVGEIASALDMEKGDVLLEFFKDDGCTETRRLDGHAAADARGGTGDEDGLTRETKGVVHIPEVLNISDR